MRRGLWIAAVVALALCAVATPALAANNRAISLSSSKFDFNAQAGQTAVGTLWVTNEGDTSASVRVYAANQTFDASGVAQYQAPAVDADVLQSPASWVTFSLPHNAKAAGNVPYVDLKPGQRMKVGFRVKIPQGAVPGDHNILLFFEMFNPPGTAVPGGTNVFGRLGARVKAHVAGEVVEKIDAVPFTMPAWVLGNTVPYSVTILNSGNVDERVSARMAQLDSSDSEISSSGITSDTPLFANASLPKSGTVKSVGYGPQRFKLVVTYPSAEESAAGLLKTVEKERQVWVVPAWVLWAGIALIVVVVVLIIWAIGRASGRRKAQKTAVPGPPPAEWG